MVISLEEAKRILRVDGSYNDATIQGIIESLPGLVESQTGLSPIAQERNPVVKQLYHMYLRQLYFGVDDVRLERSIESLLKIISLSTIEGVDYVDKVFTENGVYLAADYGADGFSSVSVEVPEPVTMSRTITANGEYCCSEENAAAVGYDTVVVDVQPVLETAAITKNGTYVPSVQGFDKVVVDVPEPSIDLESIVITAPGEYRADLSGVTGWDSIFVDIENTVNVGTLEASENGLYQVPEGLDGWNIVHVNVPAPEHECKEEIPLAVTQNGDYVPGEGQVFSSVSVNVSAESGVDIWKERYQSLISGSRGAGERLVIPEGTLSIGGYAFYASDYAGELVFPSSLEGIEWYAFYQCQNLNGTLDFVNVKTIGAYAFQYCDGFTGDLIIPDGVVFTGRSPFGSCSGLNGRLVLPSDMTLVPREFVSYCSNLIGDVEIPASVTEIAASAFSSCSKLDNFIIRNESAVVTLGSAYVFTSCKVQSGKAFVYVPDALVDSYKTATNWSAMASYIKPLSEYTGGQE